jgi:hypothetical protein
MESPDSKRSERMSGEAKIIKKQVNAARNAEQQQPVSSVQTCELKNWIELVYKYNSCRAVSGAAYEIFNAQNNQSLASGCLDNMGFVRIENLPNSVTNVRFQFSSDPKPYEIFPGYKPMPHYFTAESTVVKTEDGTVVSVAKWVGVALAGDFADDQSFGQIAFGTVVTLIPVVDQVGDVRDIVANLHRLTFRGQYNEFSPWFSLVVTLLGCIPEIGSIVKGIVKEIWLAIKTGAKKLPLKRLIELLNFVGEGNVVRFLREFLSKLHGHGQDAAKKIAMLLDALKTKLEDLRKVSFSKAEKMLDEVLENINKAFKVLPDMVRKVIEWIATHLKNTLDEATDFVMKGVTRARNGAKQLKKDFLRVTGIELKKLAKRAGMKPEHIEKLALHCQKKDRMVVVRVSNPDALKFQGKAGHLPKPLDVKLKTAKGDKYAEEIKGLVVRPKEPMAQWERDNIKYLEEHGYSFDKNGVLRDPNQNVFYGDYDVQSVHRRVQSVDPKTGKTEDVYLNELSNPEDGVDAITELNKDVVGDIPSANRPFQHGAESDFRVKLDEDGKPLYKDGKPVVVKADDLNTGGKTGGPMKSKEDYKLGRQHGDDEKYLVVDADGDYKIVESPEELKKIYDEAGLPWEYDSTFPIAPANGAK